MMRTVSVGENYYGDAGGPRIIYQDGTPAPARFLGPRGATVQLTSSNPANPQNFVWSKPSSSGPAWSDTEVFPSIWLQGVRIGQNTLPDGVSTPYLGKQTLLSLDIVASQTIPNLRVRAEFDGKSYYSQPVTLYRDLRRAGAHNVAGARTTANFILPKVDDDGPNGVPLTVDLDITGIAGDVHRPVGLDAMHLLTMDLRYSQGKMCATLPRCCCACKSLWHVLG